MSIYYQSNNPITNELSSIVHLHDGLFSFIPLDISNTDYQNYLLWVEEGNTAPLWKPEEHDLPIVTPP
jgi:hypothetical protein